MPKGYQAGSYRLRFSDGTTETVVVGRTQVAAFLTRLFVTERALNRIRAVMWGH